MAQESVTSLIRAEAQKQGVDPELAVKIATVESGLNPQAQNPKSSAAGLFQLIDKTRKELGGDPKKKMDPLENVRLGVKLIKQNQGQLMTSLGRAPTSHELYMAHMFGPTGAVKLIQSDPNMPVQKAVLQFSNPKMADRIVRDNRLSGTVGDVVAGFQQKFGKKAAGQQKTAPASKKPAAPEGPIPFQTGFDMVAMAPSYQAAVAMTKLASLGGTLDEEDEEKTAEVAPQEEDTTPSAAAMLANLQMPSLAVFAEGGDVNKEELVAPPVTVTPEEKPKSKAKAMLDKLLEKRKEMTSTLPGMAADIGASIVNPAYGMAASAADFETARREGDLLSMGLAGIGLIPAVGPALKGLGMAGPAVLGAMRPKGGVFLTSGKRDQVLSRFDKNINEVLASVEDKSGTTGGRLSPESADAIKELFDKKARKYFTTQYASTDDPIYEALKEGRILPVGEADKKMFRDYILQALRRGNPEAAEDFAAAYDRGLQRNIFVEEGKQYSGEALRLAARRGEEALTAAEAQRLAAGEKLVPEELAGMQNLTEGLQPSLIWSSDPRRKLFEEGADIPEHIKRAVQTGELVYDISAYDIPKFMKPSGAMVEQLAKIDPARLKKMSYPEAVAAVNQQMRLSADWGAMVSMAREKGAKQVPVETRSMFTSQIIPFDNGQKWVRLTDSKAAALEGGMLKHSSGGYDKFGDYGINKDGKKSFDSGDAQLFSLRTKDDLPLVTIEVDAKNNIVTQVKGFMNKNASDLLPYTDEIVTFFKNTGFAPKKYLGDLPEEILQRIRPTDNFAKGGMVDKPLYS
jgi:hypothetical protein